MTSLAALTPRQRLTWALDQAYRMMEAKGVPSLARPILALLRPRLQRSVDEHPERPIALLVWAWARIPAVIGDAVDLTDLERVAAIVAMVEEHEFGASSSGAPAREDPPAVTDQAIATAATDGQDPGAG